MPNTTLDLRVEVRPTVSIEAAAADMCRLASLLGVAVHTDFNGFPVEAQPDSRPDSLVDAYWLNRRAVAASS